MIDLKSILYSLQITIAGNGNNIKAYRIVYFLGRQVSLRCCYYTGLFCSSDALLGATDIDLSYASELRQ